MTTKTKPRSRGLTLAARLKLAEESIRRLHEYVASLDNAVARHIKESRP
jgi:hypothetical protein